MEQQEFKEKDEPTFRVPEDGHGHVSIESDGPYFEHNVGAIIYDRAPSYHATPYDDKEDRIIAVIRGHRAELEHVGTQLAKTANRYRIVARTTKVLVIFLGAFIATKEVVNQILATSNIGNIIIYAIVGLLIATLTGIDTAFQWEKKSIELGILVATCRATTRKTASDLVKFLDPTKSSQKKTGKILEVLDNALVEIQTRASEIGIDTTKYRDFVPQRTSTHK